jgi:hypothetical protein
MGMGMGLCIGDGDAAQQICVADVVVLVHLFNCTSKMINRVDIRNNACLGIWGRLFRVKARGRASKWWR